MFSLSVFRRELITETQAQNTANFWLGSRAINTVKVVMSPDRKRLSIMICDDFAKMKSLTECSFIVGTRGGGGGGG